MAPPKLSAVAAAAAQLPAGFIDSLLPPLPYCAGLTAPVYGTSSSSAPKPAPPAAAATRAAHTKPPTAGGKRPQLGSGYLNGLLALLSLKPKPAEA